MKTNYFVLLLFMLTSSIVQSENYFPQGMVWTSEDDFGNRIQRAISGDTVINGTSYQRIGTTFLRGDGKKVFVYTKSGDKLLYDFGMKVGDVIQETYISNLTGVYPKSTVSKTDTIVLKDGRNAKRIFYDKNRDPDIEYIGNTGVEGVLTPLTDMSNVDIIYHYICCSSNGDVLWEVRDGICETNDAIENVATPALTVSPNPVRDYLELQGVEAVSEVQVYDLSGQCVFRADAVRIDVTVLPAGIYLLRAVDRNNKQYQSKFVKE